MKRFWYLADHVRHRAMWRELHQMESFQDSCWREIATFRLAKLVAWSYLHVPAYGTIGSAVNAPSLAGMLTWFC